MLKRNTVLALGFAALATPWCSAPGGPTPWRPNALTPNGVTTNFTTLPGAILPPSAGRRASPYRESADSAGRKP